MKFNANSIVVILALASVIGTGRDTFADDTDTKPATNTTQYLIELSEYELEDPIPVGLDEAEVVNTILRAGIQPVETIRLTAVPETEGMVQVGKRISVTTDTMTRGDTTTRRYEELEIGTILRLTMMPHDDGAYAHISYSTSRVDGDPSGDTPPNVLTNTVQSTQVYVLGRPRLLTTVGAGKSTGILVTVRDIAHTKTGG
ncbi:hypothetical protein [Allorhodopirellula solitaria]|uniref:Uncharacterized protein n=1 Tax=Allorhodopirellula solitaria TaxID=2527987 RepID=A0A5C5XYT4_9BACT|nr:hypothetical protein [Allorhodopirellula solitaria]TWT66632.1 hypothetical protein CA85_27290 [Allorhodopirellula solitaria]